MVNQFLPARRIRREIVRNLEEQQLADSEVSARLKAAATIGVRGLLLAVGNLFQEFAKLNVVCDSDRSDFARICPTFTLDQSVASYCRLQQVEAKRDLRRGQLIEAKSAHESAAPWGFISSWTSNDSERARIAGLEREVTRLQNMVNAAEQAVGEARQELSSITEAFLRGSLRPDILGWLTNEHELGGEVVGALARFSKSIEQIWLRYAGEQFTRVSSAKELTERLCAAYASCSQSSGEVLAMSLVESNGRDH